jgi:hypothetical protein
MFSTWVDIIAMRAADGYSLISSTSTKKETKIGLLFVVGWFGRVQRHGGAVCK